MEPATTGLHNRPLAPCTLCAAMNIEIKIESQHQNRAPVWTRGLVNRTKTPTRASYRVHFCELLQSWASVSILIPSHISRACVRACVRACGVSHKFSWVETFVTAQLTTKISTLRKLPAIWYYTQRKRN